MTLFDHIVVPELFVQPAPQSTIDAAFEAFHDANPWVYRELCALARDLVARGHHRVGMKMLFEVLRWSYAMSTDDPSSDFKLNNNYTSRYARLIMDLEVDLDGVFETRRLIA